MCVCVVWRSLDARRSSKDLSPVAETPPRGEGSPIGVTRSRTLPSTRSGRSGHTSDRSTPSAAAAASTTSAAIEEGATRSGRSGAPGSGSGAGTGTGAGAGAGEGRGAATDDERDHEPERHGRVLKKPRPSSVQPQGTPTRMGRVARSPGPVGTKDIGAPVVGSLVGSANAKESAPGGGAAPAVQPIEGVPTPVQQQGQGS